VKDKKMIINFQIILLGGHLLDNNSIFSFFWVEHYNKIFLFNKLSADISELVYNYTYIVINPRRSCFMTTPGIQIYRLALM